MKIKDDKKVYFDKKYPMFPCTFLESFIGVFIYSFAMKTVKKLNIYYWHFFSSLSYMLRDILKQRTFNTLYYLLLRSCNYGCVWGPIK